MNRSYISLAILLLLLVACTGSGGGESTSLNNTHVHGLAVDQGNNSRLYIATHHGLFVLQDDTELTLVGRSRDDFMGFSPHPTDHSVLFSSGHPKGGGNLGFLKSEDAGVSWEKVSNGNPQGPADFHTMMVHPANPDHIYGWYKLRVHRSLDGGKTWEVLPKQPPEILAFAGDPRDENTVYVGAIGDLLLSTDRGETFASIAAEFKDDVVFDIEVTEENSTLILSTRDHGIMKGSRTLEGGFVLETVGVLPGGDPAYYLALDPKNSQILYTFSKAHVLYKSTNGGKAWQKLL